MANGRPTLANILARNNASATARYIARRLAQTSPLFDLLPFDASVTPNPRQRTLRYPYAMLKAARVGKLRDWYTDYPPSFNEFVEADAVLRPMGDAFEIDRVFSDADPDYVQENVDDFGPAIVGTFCDLAINGDNTADPREFTGLSKILTGTSSEIDGSAINLTAGQTDAQYYEGLAAVKKYVNRIKAKGLTPVILSGEDLGLRMETVGLRLGFVAKSQNTFGADINNFGGAAILDAGNVANGADGDFIGSPIIPVTGGLTDLYVVGFGLNGFHGVTLTGDKGVKYYQKGKTDAGVIERYEGELVAGVALKDTQAAYVLRGVRVAPGA